MPPPMEEDEEMLGAADAFAASLEEEPPVEPEKKPASDFDLVADRVFSAVQGGDQAGFRSSLRAAIKRVVADMT